LVLADAVGMPGVGAVEDGAQDAAEALTGAVVVGEVVVSGAADAARVEGTGRDS
jgi:hypothetical protein